MFGYDGLRRERLGDWRRPRSVLRLNGELGRRWRCARLIPFNECIAEELPLHEADDLLSAPDMISQKIRHALKMRVGSRNLVAQIQPILAQRCIRQLRTLRLLQYRRLSARPQFTVH